MNTRSMHGHLVQVAKIKERASINLPFSLFVPIAFSLFRTRTPLPWPLCSSSSPSPFLSLYSALSLSFFLFPPPLVPLSRARSADFYFFVRRYDGCSRSPITGLQFRHSLRRKFLDSRKDGSFSADQSRSSFASSSTLSFFSNIVDSPEIDEASVNIS